MRMPAALLALLLALSGEPAAAAADRIRMLTEEYPPYNFTENGKIVGAAVEQVTTILERAGLAFDLEILPWARAYARTEDEPMTCLFTTSHTPDRDLKFAWVEPLGVSTMVMIGRKGAGLKVASLDDIRGLKIGTQLADFTESYLRERGFNDLDLAPDFTLTLKKLESGRVDVAFTSRSGFRSLQQQGYAIEPLLELPAQVYGIACHRSFPKPLLARMQTELDRLIREGTQDAIGAKYGLPAENLAPIPQKSQ